MNKQSLSLWLVFATLVLVSCTDQPSTFLDNITYTGYTPAVGGVTTNPMPLLEWDIIEGASSYQLQLAYTKEDVSGATIIDCNTNSYQLDTALSSGDSLYWRIRAVNGTSEYTIWSGIVDFRHYALGCEGPAGGIIFYIDEADEHSGWVCLEAAPDSWNGPGEDTSIYWAIDAYSSGDTSMHGSHTGTSIGSGHSNTDVIVTYMTVVYSDTREHCAAMICADLELGGYDDWFLPSRDELYLMCYYNSTFAPNGLVSPLNLNDNYYYSSSEIFDGIDYGYDDSAWIINPGWDFSQTEGEGYQQTSPWSVSWPFRPIRAF